MDETNWLDELLSMPAEEVAREQAEAEQRQRAIDSGFARWAETRRFLIAQGKCGKCSGRGRLGAYSHVADGVCFRCGGDGTEPGWTPPSSVRPSTEYLIRLGS